VVAGSGDLPENLHALVRELDPCTPAYFLEPRHSLFDLGFVVLHTSDPK
jgi:hypothetical protein